MITYHSFQQAPHLSTAKHEISRDFLNCQIDNKYHKFLYYIDKTEDYKNNIINEAFINADVLKENNSVIKYSYSNWYIFGRSDVMNEVTKIIIREFNKHDNVV